MQFQILVNNSSFVFLNALKLDINKRILTKSTQYTKLKGQNKNNGFLSLKLSGNSNYINDSFKKLKVSMCHSIIHQELGVFLFC